MLYPAELRGQRRDCGALGPGDIRSLRGDGGGRRGRALLGAPWARRAAAPDPGDERDSSRLGRAVHVAAGGRLRLRRLRQPRDRQLGRAGRAVHDRRARRRRAQGDGRGGLRDRPRARHLDGRHDRAGAGARRAGAPPLADPRLHLLRRPRLLADRPRGRRPPARGVRLGRPRPRLQGRLRGQPLPRLPRRRVPLRRLHRDGRSASRPPARPSSCSCRRSPATTPRPASPRSRRRPWSSTAPPTR